MFSGSCLETQMQYLWQQRPVSDIQCRWGEGEAAVAAPRATLPKVPPFGTRPTSPSNTFLLPPHFAVGTGTGTGCYVSLASHVLFPLLFPHFPSAGKIQPRCHLTQKFFTASS